MARIHRRFRNRFKMGVGEFQAASMSDIAFLLLIFFIMTTIFAVEEGVPLLLPVHGAAVTRVKKDRVLEVRAHADETVTVDGDQIALVQLASEVASRLDDQGDLIVVLATHPEADYGFMVEVLDELKLANCRRISLQTIGG